MKLKVCTQTSTVATWQSRRLMALDDGKGSDQIRKHLDRLWEKLWNGIQSGVWKQSHSFTFQDSFTSLSFLKTREENMCSVKCLVGGSDYRMEWVNETGWQRLGWIGFLERMSEWHEVTESKRDERQKKRNVCVCVAESTSLCMQIFVCVCREEHVACFLSVCVLIQPKPSCWCLSSQGNFKQFHVFKKEKEKSFNFMVAAYKKSGVAWLSPTSVCVVLLLPPPSASLSGPLPSM